MELNLAVISSMCASGYRPRSSWRILSSFVVQVLFLPRSVRVVDIFSNLLVALSSSFSLFGLRSRRRRELLTGKKGSQGRTRAPRKGDYQREPPSPLPKREAKGRNSKAFASEAR